MEKSINSDNYNPKSIINGKVIRLRHSNTRRILHYENSVLNKGKDFSGQVTGSKGRDYNDWWKVEAEPGHILNGSLIKLRHLITNKYLVSDLIYISSMSQMQGVTCLKDPNDDTNIWSILIESEETWNVNSSIKLINFKSGAFLYSHEVLYENGDEEITCSLSSENADNDLWLTIEACNPNEIMDLSYDDAY